MQNLTSFFLGKHTLVVGGRLRDVQDSNTSNENFNGTFTFPSLTAYQTAEQGLQDDLPCKFRPWVADPASFSLSPESPRPP